MCPESCTVFTGPYANLTACPMCNQPRYVQGDNVNHPTTLTPRRQFIAIPIGPVIQAFYQNPESARHMHHRVERTASILEYANAHNGKIEVYDDIYCGKDYLDAVHAGRIGHDDVALQISQDGAQLFCDKKSDCWMYIFVIQNLPPHLQYKKDWS